MVQDGKKRVLLVERTASIRKAVSQAIAHDPALELAASLIHGHLALTKFSSLRPDIVLLGMAMPEMEGLETIRELRRIAPQVPIILFADPSAEGASIPSEALALGATDYITKPDNVDARAALATFADEVMPRIRALCQLPAGQNWVPAISKLPSPILVQPRRLLAPAKVVVIGSSTGGPDALALVVASLPDHFQVPVLIAQHMPPIFTTMLAERLGTRPGLPVRECISGEPVSPGSAVIAPGDFHMEVKQENGSPVLKTHQGPRENFCRPSVDVLFRSVAQAYGERALAVVLTGMGQDGLKGCEVLREAGSRIYVQDEASSVVWGMPGFIVRAGLADKVLPLDRIASEIVRATTVRIAARSSV